MDEEKVKRICDELKVSELEALFYLEGFEWKLDKAMQACRTKTLPPVKAKSAPRVPVNKRSAAEESSAAPLDVTPLRILSHEASIQREDRSRDELVTEFRKVVPGASVKFAVDCLEASSWNLPVAVGSIWDKNDPTPGQLESQHHSGIDRSTNEALNFQRRTILRSNLQRLRRSNLLGSSPDGSTSTDVHSPSQFQASHDNIAGSSGSSSKDMSLEEAGLINVPVTASSQEEKIDPTARVLSNQRPQFSDGAIQLFCNITGMNENIAIDWLIRFNGNVNRAIDGYFKPSDYQSTLGQSSSMEHVEDVTSKPTKESGDDQNVTVAIPPMASSSQVDKSKAIADEQDSSAEMIIEDPQAEEPDDFVTIQIIFSSPEETVDMQFGADDTLGDIRNAIAVLRPGDTREYSFMSESFEVFVDINVTVSHLVSRTATTLIQLYSD